MAKKIQSLDQTKLNSTLGSDLVAVSRLLYTFFLHCKTNATAPAPVLGHKGVFFPMLVTKQKKNKKNPHSVFDSRAYRICNIMQKISYYTEEEGRGIRGASGRPVKSGSRPQPEI